MSCDGNDCKFSKMLEEQVEVFNEPAVILALRFAHDHPDVVYRDYPDVLEVVRGGYLGATVALDRTLFP